MCVHKLTTLKALYLWHTVKFSLCTNEVFQVVKKLCVPVFLGNFLSKTNQHKFNLGDLKALMKLRRTVWSPAPSAH